jgi:putative (di)nucleoside polyphosphate hydrolase
MIDQKKKNMIDPNGYRLNVGIVISNQEGKLFWGKRVKVGGWQFPQGGVQPYETLEETMYRELAEETGLTKEHVKILATTRNWFRYKLPTHLRHHSQKPLCIGQKQKWFLLLLTSDESKINLKAGGKPEFTDWCWVDYWEPLKQVIYFKKEVYSQVLKVFEKTITKQA